MKCHGSWFSKTECRNLHQGIQHCLLHQQCIHEGQMERRYIDDPPFIPIYLLICMLFSCKYQLVQFITGACIYHLPYGCLRNRVQSYPGFVNCTSISDWPPILLDLWLNGSYCMCFHTTATLLLAKQGLHQGFNYNLNGRLIQQPLFY